MARFNQTIAPVEPDTVNFAGGASFQKSVKLELVTLVANSLLVDKAYETAGGEKRRLILLTQHEPEFAAKLAIFARHNLNLRSVTHLIAATIPFAKIEGGWKREFYRSVIRRPDDMLEIIAAYRMLGGKSLPRAMKRGFADKLASFDEYQLKKYVGAGREWNLYDVINLTHPKRTPAIKAFMEGKAEAKTWEREISAAGGDKDARKASWAELLTSGKLGYMALVRNLRTLSSEVPELIDVIEAQLKDEERIRRSGILPHQLLVASESLRGDIALASLSHVDRLIDALDEAMKVSFQSCAELPGETLLAVDVSSSMQWGAGLPGISVARLASLFAAGMYIANPSSTLVTFSYDVKVKRFSRNDSLYSIAGNIATTPGGGTDFSAIFDFLEHPYDNIVIFTDGEGWLNGGAMGVLSSLASYKRRTKARPAVCLWDLGGNPTMQFPEDEVMCFGGISANTFDLLRLHGRGFKSLVPLIEERITLGGLL